MPQRRFLQSTNLLGLAVIEHRSRCVTEGWRGGQRVQWFTCPYDAQYSNRAATLSLTYCLRERKLYIYIYIYIWRRLRQVFARGSIITEKVILSLRCSFSRRRQRRPIFRPVSPSLLAVLCGIDGRKSSEFCNRKRTSSKR